MRSETLGDWWELVDERRDGSGRLLETEVEAHAYTIPKLWEHVQTYIESPGTFHPYYTVGKGGDEIDKVRFMAPEYNGDGTIREGGWWSIRFIVTWKEATPTYG